MHGVPELAYQQQIADEVAGDRVPGLLGEGRTGSVCKAEQDRPKRRVALKATPSKHIHTETVTSRTHAGRPAARPSPRRNLRASVSAPPGPPNPDTSETNDEAKNAAKWARWDSNPHFPEESGF